MIRVGIPRALLYYQYFPMWKAFFEHLGAKVVVSPPTSKAILAQGSARVVAETCLPTKVYVGHVAALASQCDCVFVPSIRSIEDDVYNCSKFLGLPDLVKAVVPGCPPILAVDIDVNKGKRDLFASIYDLGRRFTWNPLKVKEASAVALAADQHYRTLLRQERLTPPEALLALGLDAAPPYGVREREMRDANRQSELTIAVVGHPYNLYDGYINHQFLRRLRALGADLLTPEMVTDDDLAAGVARLVGRPYWTYEDEVVGAAGHFLQSAADGVISVVCFGCGPDSVMLDVVQRSVKQYARKPFVSLVIDEHTGEAGLITRLEAFADMLLRRKRRYAHAAR